MTDDRTPAERIAVIRELQEIRETARLAIVQALTGFPIPDNADSKADARRWAHHMAAGHPDDAQALERLERALGLD